MPRMDVCCWCCWCVYNGVGVHRWRGVFQYTNTHYTQSLAILVWVHEYSTAHPYSRTIHKSTSSFILFYPRSTSQTPMSCTTNRSIRKIYIPNKTLRIYFPRSYSHIIYRERERGETIVCVYTTHAYTHSIFFAKQFLIKISTQ